MSDKPVEANSSILIYQSEDGKTRIDVRLADKTVWLSQATLAELYQTTRQNISVHIRNLYSEKELIETATCKDYLQVQDEGRRRISRTIKLYNLDMIIAIGYRVSSHRGTQFRRWATERLREYLIKGFTMDDARIKEGRNLGEDYFEELLERIRDIRASEKLFYRKITDIYRLAIDYDPDAEITHDFFATVQNKLHYAIHGHTAAELITTRAKANKPHMGLTSWKGAKVRRTDVTVAKNYLNESELKSLNRIVTMYLDYAEDQAQRQNPMFMRNWKDKLDAFLRFNNRDVLNDPGKVSAEIAQQLALKEYDKYSRKRLAAESTEIDTEFEDLAKIFEKKHD